MLRKQTVVNEHSNTKYRNAFFMKVTVIIMVNVDEFLTSKARKWTQKNEITALQSSIYT